MKNALKLSLSLYCLMSSFMVQAESPVTVKEDNPNYSQDITYPQGFEFSETNATIRDFIAKNQSSFRKSLKDASTPASAPGKTSLNIQYTIPYHTKDALSVRFNVSMYRRGAAHPENHVMVLNFIHGKKVLLSDLFVPKSNYLEAISSYCREQMIAKNDSDKDWIRKGTSARPENYDLWYFTTKSIAVVFDTYQVAAYVYGPQTIELPKAIIAPFVKPGLKKIVWSSDD